MEPCSQTSTLGWLFEEGCRELRITEVDSSRQTLHEVANVVYDRNGCRFKDEEDDDTPLTGTAVLDPELFSMLKNLRKKIARKLEIPPYVIFQDVSLEQMAMMYPINEEELQNNSKG